MEKQPLNKEFTLEEKAKARGQAEMILAESKASKKNFPMGSPMSEKEFMDWYIENKEKLAAIEKELTPEERVKARARAQAEMLLAQARAEGQATEEWTEKEWVDDYVKVNVQMWKDWVAKSRKGSVRVPTLKWDVSGSKWSLVYDWGEEPPQWGTARSRVE